MPFPVIVEEPKLLEPLRVTVALLAESEEAVTLEAKVEVPPP